MIQFSTDMDSLELHLKLDKMDPALMPDSSVKHKNEMYQKMTTDWTEVDNKGKQLVKDAAEVQLSAVHSHHPLPSRYGIIHFAANQLANQLAGWFAS